MVLVGLLFGFVVGVALVAGFQYVMQYRNRRRVQKKLCQLVQKFLNQGVPRVSRKKRGIHIVEVAGIHLLNTIHQEELRRLCGNSFPNSISFPTFEKVNWLNSNLEKIWPYVVAATEPLVKEILGPILEQYRPPGISSLKMDKFNIGTVPPKIDGIRVQSLRKSQVIMDMEFRWGGDASIILAINPVVGPRLPVQMKNLSFYATVRVIFQLSEEMPCISALVVALLANPKPQIKYTLKVIGGSTGAIPGLGEMIEDLVESSVADQLEWPHRIVVPIGNPLPDVISDLQLKLQGKLRVTVVRATALKNMERIGKSDPYVRLFVRVLFKAKTKVIDNNLNPEWNETFYFDVEDTETQTLIMQVKDEDVGTRDKLLGVTSLSLNDLKPDMEVEIVKKLQPDLDTNKVKDKGDRGTITIRLLFHPYTKEEQDKAMEAEKRFLQAKEDAKNDGIIGGTMDAVGGGVKIVGSGIGAGVGAVGSGVGMVGTGLGKAGKLMSSGVKRFSSSNKLISPVVTSPANGSPMHENGTAKSKEA